MLIKKLKSKILSKNNIQNLRKKNLAIINIVGNVCNFKYIFVNDWVIALIKVTMILLILMK